VYLAMGRDAAHRTLDSLRIGSAVTTGPKETGHGACKRPKLSDQRPLPPEKRGGMWLVLGAGLHFHRLSHACVTNIAEMKRIRYLDTEVWMTYPTADMLAA